MDSTWTKILLYFFTLMCHKLRNVGIHLVYISTRWVDGLTCGLCFFFFFFLLPWLWEFDTKLSVFSWSMQANLGLSLTQYDRCLLYPWRECLKPTWTVLMTVPSLVLLVWIRGRVFSALPLFPLLYKFSFLLVWFFKLSVLVIDVHCHHRSDSGNQMFVLVNYK